MLTGSRRRARRAGVVAAAATGVVLATSLAVVAVGPGDAPAATPLTNWTTYHFSANEAGVAPVSNTFAHPVHAWTSPVLNGQIYGEPLVQGSEVVVATEHDAVYALRTSNGTVLWSRTVGTPVPASSLPCGNITPTVGITGTPVIDAARGEVFVVADEVAGAAISHHLVGLSLATGAVVLNRVVDPPGPPPAAQLQRPGLALDRGSVIIGFGGNAGDCSTYHGWVVSVPEGGGTPHIWEADASAGHHEGAVWLGGAAPVVDTSGHVWVTTGNGSNTSGASPDGGDSVVELTASMTVMQTFTPSTWRTDNASDFDLGSSPPALMGNGLVFEAGKSHVAYLLSEGHLGGVGGQLTQQAAFCSDDVDGGEAFTTTLLYAPCLTGVTAVKVNAKKHAMHVLWRTSTGATGPPIIIGNRVWTIRRSDGTLFGLHKGTGKPAVTLTLPSPPANHFPTPSVGAGLLLAASANQVSAWR